MRKLSSSLFPFTRFFEVGLIIIIFGLFTTIAVSQLQDSQARTDIARSMSDMRKVNVALCAYNTEFGGPPNWGFYNGSIPTNHVGWLMLFPAPGRFIGEYLTTPIAFIDEIPADSFNSSMIQSATHFTSLTASFWLVIFPPDSFAYSGGGWAPISEWWKMFMENIRPGYSKVRNGNFVWELTSVGPDRLWWNDTSPPEYFYDPTNGLVSGGQLIYYSDGVSFPRP